MGEWIKKKEKPSKQGPETGRRGRLKIFKNFDEFNEYEVRGNGYKVYIKTNEKEMKKGGSVRLARRGGGRAYGKNS